LGILVVDDSKMFLSFFETILKNAGYGPIYTANSSFEALDILHLNPGSKPEEAPSFDLVLLDVIMPGMSGIDVCRQIKKHELYHDLPIVFVTAAAHNLPEAFQAGGIDFIRKGCEEIEILARVRSVLQLKRETDLRKQREAKMLKELQLAKNIQNSVLSNPIVEERIEIHGKYIQSAELSGDMSYWAQVDTNRYGAILIDVAGHGLSSALISMSLRSLLSGLVKRVKEPELIFQELNKHMIHLYGNGNRLIYFTAIYVLIDTSEKTIQYMNAGHPPGLAVADGQASKLDVTCVPVGVKPNPVVNTGQLSYTGEMRIVLYTDGLVEVRGKRISSGIEALEADAKRFHTYDGESFVEKITGLRENREDDVCLISIYLKS
jgi:sigma-B regulation protein RsbU (phosphoserine phosphatase)